jgi:Skp family chaperone for outer membrane proteins
MVKYLILIFFSFSFSFSAIAKDLVIVDIDFLIKNSKIGKKILTDINSENKKIIEKFKSEEENFKIEESKLVSKKKILSDVEFQKELSSFKNKIVDYNSNKNRILNDFNIKKNNKFAKFYDDINKILITYSEKNDITTVLDKKNVLISRSDTDITKNILNIIDNK